MLMNHKFSDYGEITWFVMFIKAELLCTMITHTGTCFTPLFPTAKKGKTTCKENIIPFVASVRLRKKSKSSIAPNVWS